MNKEPGSIIYYLWKNDLTYRSFSKTVGIDNRTLSSYAHGHIAPNLFNALKIHYASQRKIDLESMLTEEQMISLNDINILYGA